MSFLGVGTLTMQGMPGSNGAAGETRLSITETGGDLVIYDREQQVIHSLNPMAARIWSLAHGTNEVTAIADQTQLTTETVGEALDQLARAGLLAGPPTSPQSRRRLLKRTALAGVMAPAVVSLTAPLAAAAQTTAACRYPPSPYVSIQSYSSEEVRTVTAYVSGYCPNFTYYAQVSRRQSTSEGGDPTSFTTDAGGCASFQVFSGSPTSYLEIRVNADYFDTGWVLIPSSSTG